MCFIWLFSLDIPKRYVMIIVYYKNIASNAFKNQMFTSFDKIEFISVWCHKDIYEHNHSQKMSTCDGFLILVNSVEWHFQAICQCVWTSNPKINHSDINSICYRLWEADTCWWKLFQQKLRKKKTKNQPQPSHKWILVNQFSSKFTHSQNCFNLIKMIQ